jgi:hypothetical protein
MPRSHGLSILTLGMDGRARNASQRKDGALQEWQRNATDTISRSLERPSEAGGISRSRSAVQTTIRTVTPEGERSKDTLEPGMMTHYDASMHTSPRSLPGGEKPSDRRQGLVFDTSFDDGDGNPNSHYMVPKTRPRTRTLDESARQRANLTTVSKSRHRIGSVHSAGSAGFSDPRPGLEIRSPTSTVSSGPTKDKKANAKRLTKRASSRPSSPLGAPSVDSLAVPVATNDANKILALMRSLCGRMRGAVEHKTAPLEPWIPGFCYIDEGRSALMYEGGDRGPFHQVIVPDLRGCQVRPVYSAEKQEKCLAILSPSSGIEIRIWPIASADFDYWLAAFLCWQQVRPQRTQLNLPRAEAQYAGDGRPNFMRRASSATPQGKDGTIIKVGRLNLWDKGPPVSPASVGRSSSSRDIRVTSHSWRKVSCTLQDNGEFRLLTENDVTVLSVIQLSQLSRCAIQQLDRSVLGEEYCIGIFPQYTSNSTTLSIIRPVYISLESRVLFEVWFVLLRAFSIPEIYGPEPITDISSEFASIPETHITPTTDMFRLEKSIKMRLIEAKINKILPKSDPTATRGGKQEVDPSIGDYYAEVIMDGEVRARTMTKYETRNPFWREDCEFYDLPASLPNISVIIKRIDAVVDAPSHGFRSSGSIHGPASFVETTCGYVDVRLERVERGKDTEAWWQVVNRHEEVIGEILLKIRHDELAVLLAKDYQPVSELLHKFIGGLTLQIAAFMPKNLRALSEILMNIFQVSGQASEWLMALVEDEIDGLAKETPVKRLRYSRRVPSNDTGDLNGDREQIVRDMGKSLTGEANLLFRGNSLLTQALDYHMRRVGKEYMEETLRDTVMEINALDPDCEVDPSRIMPGQDVNKNWNVLVSFTKKVWDNIAGSVNRCPPELRQILKYIRAVAEDRYGDFLRTAAYTSVSGFLFLRFFCPAILNPKLFDLLKDHPRPKAQRALTLIAKSLQALANLSSFGQKEEWMEPMNRFLASNRIAVKNFLDNICSLPAQRGPVPLPPSYSTPITILSRLPATSREGFPSLPYLIDHARNFAALVKLWLESTEHLEPISFEGDLAAFNDLCVGLAQRTDECLARASDAEEATERLSLQWEEIAENLEYASIHETIADLDTDPYAPPRTSQSDAAHPFPEFTASTTNSSGQATAPGSAGSEENGRERERQSFWEAKFGKDSRYQRPYETENVAQSPPSRGPSRNGKQHKSFLSGLRKKNTRDREREEDVGPKGEGNWV